jgi:hypothetical protein
MFLGRNFSGAFALLLLLGVKFAHVSRAGNGQVAEVRFHTRTDGRTDTLALSQVCFFPSQGRA